MKATVMTPLQFLQTALRSVRSRPSAIAAFGVVAGTALSGCGGSGAHTIGSIPTASVTGTTRAQGKVTLTIAWPKATRVIPAITNSIQLIFTDQAPGNSPVTIQSVTETDSNSIPPTVDSTAGKITIQRPAGTTGSSSVTVTLPTGQFYVDVEAYPAGSTTRVASANISFTLTTAGSSLPITLDNTIATFQITPSNITVSNPLFLTVGDPLVTSIQAQAKDINGNIVLVADSAVQWTVSSNPALSNPAVGLGRVYGITNTLTALQSTSGKQVTVTATNSEVNVPGQNPYTASIPVVVKPGIILTGSGQSPALAPPLSGLLLQGGTETLTTTLSGANTSVVRYIVTDNATPSNTVYDSTFLPSADKYPNLITTLSGATTFNAPTPSDPTQQVTYTVTAYDEESGTKGTPGAAMSNPVVIPVSAASLTLGVALNNPYLLNGSMVLMQGGTATVTATLTGVAGGLQPALLTFTTTGSPVVNNNNGTATFTAPVDTAVSAAGNYGVSAQYSVFGTSINATTSIPVSSVSVTVSPPSSSIVHGNASLVTFTATVNGTVASPLTLYWKLSGTGTGSLGLSKTLATYSNTTKMYSNNTNQYTPSAFDPAGSTITIGATATLPNINDQPATVTVQ